MRLISWLAALVLAGPVFAVDVTIDFGPKAKTATGKDEYKECVKHVEKVGPCLLLIGMPDGYVPRAYYTSFTTPEVKGFSPGVYLCEMYAGEPSMSRRPELEPAVVVPTAMPYGPTVTFPQSYTAPFTFGASGAAGTTCANGNCGAGTVSAFQFFSRRSR